MEALLVDTIPAGKEWQYEPKWDGFRCLAFKDGKNVELQSKSGRSVGRYFPELIFALKEIKTKKFVLDNEIVIPVQGSFSFDGLLQRIHPAEAGSRTCLRVSCEFGRLGLADFCRLETVLEEIKEHWHGRPSRSFL